MSNVIVEFSGIEKTFDGEKNVVNDLNLKILDGEFITLLGPSGSGKTTTLMMLAGFEQPTSGDIRLRGSSLMNVPPHSRNMGIVFQNYALFPHMNVRKNIAYPLVHRRRSKSEIRKKVNQILEMVELDTLGDRDPSQLSGGQQQRVALARALVFEPELVLMDEPLGALDKRLREQMQIELKRLHEALGMTFVYVTHDQSEALTMSDRVAIFNDGVVQQLDKPNEIYEQPVNSFVANFVGENNVFYGTVEQLTEDRCNVVLSSGERIEATSVGGISLNEKTTLSIRPERIFVENNDKNLRNKVKGEVLEQTYFGDHARIRCRIADNENVIVKISIENFTDNVKVGASINLVWDVGHCRALPYE